MDNSVEKIESSHTEKTQKRHESYDSVGHGAHDEEEGEPWLLSYADMVTLLMCFFILFFTLDKSKGGISDPERVKEKLEKMIQIDPAVLTPPSAGGSGFQQDSLQTQYIQDELKMSRLKEKFTEDLKSFGKKLKVVFSLASPNPATLEITFLHYNFFASGSSELTMEGQTMLQKTTPRLLSLEPGTLIEIEGHTDSDPIRTGKFTSNWDLSTARATSVAQFLALQGLKPEQFKISGYGPYRPVVPEKDERGIEDPAAKKLNRRVIIRVSLDVSRAKTPPLDKAN